MPDRVTRIVLIPRHTALYGTVPHVGAPVNVRRFGSSIITAWRSKGMGLPGSQASAAFQLQQSMDMVIWENVDASFSPPAEQETPVTRDLDFEWIRLVATISGANPGTTCWAVGHFLAREGILGGE